MTNGKRPLGVTLIGILYVLVGLFYLMLGLVLVAASSTDIEQEWGTLDSTIVMVMGVIVALVGLIAVLVGVGCFKGWGWVWTLGVVVISLGIVIQIVQTVLKSEITNNDIASAAVSVIVSLLILAYLFKQNVKEWFGKAKPATIQTPRQ